MYVGPNFCLTLFLYSDKWHIVFASPHKKLYLFLAIMLKQSELKEKFDRQFDELIFNEELRSDLATNFKKLAKPYATAAIVNEIIKIIEE